MKKIFVIVLVLTSMLAIDLKAQILNEPEAPARDSFYEDISFKQRKPFTFPYVRAADVVWKWRIWRVIDFREKQNQVFYYPIAPDQGRVNFFYALEEAINDGRIKIYLDDEFKNEILNWQERKMALIPAQTTTIDVEDIDGTLYQKDTTIQIALKTEDIKTLRIKEDWFIDKSRTVQDVRISGFSPIFYRAPDDGGTPIPYPLFWVRYDDPEVRNLLANTEVYNFKNDAQRRTYDDIFLKRMFSSYIIKESNTYSTRTLNQYTSGDEALLESNNIKDAIYNFEEDMWEY